MKGIADEGTAAVKLRPRRQLNAAAVRKLMIIKEERRTVMRMMSKVVIPPVILGGTTGETVLRTDGTMVGKGGF